MITRENLGEIVLQALQFYGGQATNLEIAIFIWENYETELKASGDIFFGWQYDARWAITKLRHAGVVETVGRKNRRSLIQIKHN